MTTYRVRQIADLLGVSDDTVRRWADSGRLPATRDAAGRVVVAGEDLARFADEQADRAGANLPGAVPRTSSATRLTGLVTRVTGDGLLCRVELRCGPFRVVSVLPRETVEELALEPGSLAVAGIAATDVVLERPLA